MKAARMFVIIFSLVLIQIANADFDAIHEKCRTETGIEKSAIDDANKGVFSEDGKFKCYLKCVTVSVGVMNEGGEIVMTDEVMKIFPDDVREPIKKMVNKCGPKLKSADLCERAYELHTCAHNSDPDGYFLF